MQVERATVTAIETAPWARNWLNCLPLYLLPHHALSRLMLVATRLRFRPWKDWQIRWFIRRYGVDMDSVAESDPRVYPEFNSFFTRALRGDARPSRPILAHWRAPSTVACPSSATSETGRCFKPKDSTTVCPGCWQAARRERSWGVISSPCI